LTFWVFEVRLLLHRALWAFSRDGGLPLHRVWAAVNGRTGTPVNAVWAMTAAAFLLGLPILAFPDNLACNAVGIACVGLDISCAHQPTHRHVIQFAGFLFAVS
jgi:amino acid transporter